VTVDHKNENFYLLNILYTHQDKQLWLGEIFLGVQIL
jgi:hypothetical protein